MRSSMRRFGRSAAIGLALARHPGRSEAESREPGTPSCAVVLLGAGSAPHRFALRSARDHSPLTLDEHLVRTLLRRRDLDRAIGGAAEALGAVHVLHRGGGLHVTAGRDG